METRTDDEKHVQKNRTFTWGTNQEGYEAKKVKLGKDLKAIKRLHTHTHTQSKGDKGRFKSSIYQDRYQIM